MGYLDIYVEMKVLDHFPHGLCPMGYVHMVYVQSLALKTGYSVQYESLESGYLDLY
jgi:hypothetical protein